MKTYKKQTSNTSKACSNEASAASTEVASRIKETSELSTDPLPISFKVYSEKAKYTCLGFVYLRELEDTRASIENRVVYNGDDTVLLFGFPGGAGMTSALVSNFIVEHLKLDLIGDFVCEYLEPTAVIVNGEPQNPIRIYANKWLTVITSDVELMSSGESSSFDKTITKTAHDVIKLVFEFAKRHHCKFLTVMEGITGNPDKVRKALDFNIKLSPNLEQANEEDEDEGYNEEGEDDSDNKMMDSEDEQEYIDLDTPQTTHDYIRILNEAVNESKNNTSSDNRIWYLTNSYTFGKSLSQKGYKPLRNANLVGFTGGILNEAATRKDIKVSVLFSRVNKYVPIGVRAAINLLNSCNEILKESDTLLPTGIQAKHLSDSETSKSIFDTTKMEETARQLEDKLKKVVANLTGTTTREKAAKRAYNTSMYY